MRARRLTIAALPLLATGYLAIAPQVASALEPGVHIDPGSPAAKEYALPLSQARRTGAESGPAGSSETLFGAGIKPGGSGGSGGPGSAPRGARARRPDARPGGGSGGESSQPAPPPALGRALDPRASSGDGSLPVLIGGGVAVLVLGAFGGTVLRHSRRPLLGDDQAR